MSTSPVRSIGHRSWMRPLRSTRSRKTSFPMSRRAMTRPASRRLDSAAAPFSSGSASARTDVTSSRSGERLGGVMNDRLRGLDVHDLEGELAARRGDLDRLALLAAHDRAADRRLVGELVLGRIRLCGADDVVLDGLPGLDVAQANLRADRHLARLDLLLRHDARALQPLLEHRDTGLEMGLFVLRRVVLGVLGDVAELACLADAVRDLAPLVDGQIRDLLLELLEALRRENDFLQKCPPRTPGTAYGGRGWYSADRSTSNEEGYDAQLMQGNLRESWFIEEV